MSIELYFVLGVALIILARVIHYRVITRYLKSRGIEVAKGSRAFSDWKEWKAYKVGRLSEKQPITWWYVLLGMQALVLLWVGGWICNGLGWIKIEMLSHVAQGAADSSGYTTVFDVTQAGFRQWKFSVIGLMLVAAGLAIRPLVRIGVMRPQYPWMLKWFPRVFVGFAIVWTLISFSATFADYRGAVSAMRSNQAKVVEGIVIQFRPMPYTGHAKESFVVEGIRFEYSDYTITAGFNNTTSHGGPIREGLPVKIWYAGNKILRLDIKQEPAKPL